MSLNRATIIGNLGKDPELRSTTGGKDVCTFSIASNEKWKDKEGQSHEKVEWHRIVVWGPQAKPCGQYLAKGRQVYVEGKIRTRTYEQDGVKKYTTEIQADRVVFLQGGEKKEAGATGGKSTGGGAPPPPDDEDVPF